MHSGLYRNG